MPFSSRAIQKQRRAQVRARDGIAPCALQITDACRLERGVMDYDTRDNRNPRQFTVDHIISSEEARQIGWSPADADALSNCQGVCRECNREKGDGMGAVVEVAPTWVNPRFAHLI